LVVPLDAPPSPPGLNPERPFCVEAPPGVDPLGKALAVSRATKFDIFTLPHPASPNLAPSPDSISFCTTPTRCAGCTACPNRPACTE
jgi:hypothetical protein